MRHIAAASDQPRLRAVIFDCDGTLADSEPLCDMAWSSIVQAYGYHPTAEDFHACRGISYAASRDYFASRVPGLPDAADLYPDYWAALERLYRSDLRPFADAVALLDQLRTELPVAIASSSYRHRLAVTLEILGIDGLPCVAGDEVSAPKPAPDLFLAAAELLAVPAHACLVVEDSQPGIDAARAAGMTVLAIRRGEENLSRYHELTTRLDLPNLRTLQRALPEAPESPIQAL